jgi:hypothetical protein
MSILIHFVNELMHDGDNTRILVTYLTVLNGFKQFDKLKVAVRFALYK